MNTKVNGLGTKLFSKKRKFLTDDSDSDDDDFEDSAPTDFGFSTRGDHSYMPLYLIAEWNEPISMTKRISMAIVLSSGVEPGNFSVRVGEGGQYVELTVAWPPVLSI